MENSNCNNPPDDHRFNKGFGYAAATQMTESTGTAGTCSASSCPQREMTIGEYLTQQIQSQRAAVEKSCIKKAKAEALNLLDMPYSFLQSLTW